MPFGVPVYRRNHCLWWKPQWKPRVWQPFDLVTFRGNRTGNRQPGSHHIALWGANLGCELTGALQRVCVPIVLTGPRTIVAQLAPTGLSRAPECVTFVREGVREGSFMGLVFTISVECVGDRWEWSLLMVTANGHWLGCVARCWPKIDAARTNFC